MEYVFFGMGLVAGFVAGIGATLFYMKRKMQNQIGSIEEHLNAMDEMMDQNNELLEDVGDIEEREQDEREK